MRAPFVAAALFFILLFGAAPAVPAGILPVPLPDHPRLLASSGDWERMRRQIQSDPVSARVFQLVKARGDIMLGLPLLERTMTGRRLLSISRAALGRITTLAMLANVTEDPRYARRAIAEMLDVARFSDWNPSHFLDVAEMSLALATGYDWLYDRLTPEQRDEIARALLEKGLRPSLTTPEPSFVRASNNWNQVCHAGLSAAAIALADREPALAEKVLQRAVQFLPLAAESYAPDGAYLEGPMYWGYGTLFHVVLAAAMERLTGSTLGLADFPGFSASADYMVQVTTPLGTFFDYSDSVSTRRIQIPLFWFARHFNRPDWIAADVRALNLPSGGLESGGTEEGFSERERLFPLILLWLLPTASHPDASAAPPPLRWYGRGKNPLVVLRSSFGDRDALYFAIKGGSPALSHAHMDAGSFMLVLNGVEWTQDLGMQDYESLEKLNIPLWDKRQGRWTVFRLGPESHNIPRFNRSWPLVSGDAQFPRVQLEGNRPFAVLDLTSLYSNEVERAERGVMMLDGQALLLQDEWQGRDRDTEYRWQFLTSASVEPARDRVLLRKDGKALTLAVLDGVPVEISVEKADDLLQSFDARNPGTQRVTIRTTTAAKQQGRLRVLAYSGSAKPSRAPEMLALAAWGAPSSVSK